MGKRKDRAIEKEMLEVTKGVRLYKVSVVYLVCTDSSEHAEEHVMRDAGGFFDHIKSEALPLNYGYDDNTKGSRVTCNHPDETDGLKEEDIPF